MGSYFPAIITCMKMFLTFASIKPINIATSAIVLLNNVLFMVGMVSKRKGIWRLLVICVFSWTM